MTPRIHRLIEALHAVHGLLAVQLHAIRRQEVVVPAAAARLNDDAAVDALLPYPRLRIVAVGVDHDNVENLPEVEQDRLDVLGGDEVRQLGRGRRAHHPHAGALVHAVKDEVGGE